MSDGRITRYVEPRITGFLEAEVLEPKPLHEGWDNYVSQRSVRAIAIAPRSGHMWLATWGGVLCWKRKEEFLYRRYSSEHGLASNAVACLCLDREEHPWVGHVEGGLSYFDGQRWQVYEYLHTVPICAVASADLGGGIWAAGEDRVYRIKGPGQEPKEEGEKHEGAATAQALLDNGETVLLGNAWGLFHLQIGRNPERIAPEVIPACTALTKDINGAVWAGTPHGIFRLGNGAPEGPFAPDDASQVGHVLGLAAGRKRIWVLTTTDLAWIEEGEWTWATWHEQEQAPPTLRAIAATSDDTYVWLGTDRLLAGVRSTRSETEWDLDLLPPHAEDALNNLGRCVTLQPSNGRVWIGTAKGLIRFGPGDDWAVHNIPEDDIRDLSASTIKEDDLWVLTWPHGVLRLNALGQLFSQQLSGLPLALAVGQDGYTYVATGQGLWKLGADDTEEVSSNMPAPSVSCLAQTPDEKWWLGTTQGVWQQITGGWQLAGEQPGPAQAGVYTLSVINDTLWAATGAGLWARRDDTWALYGLGVENTPFSVRALAASSDDALLWLAREEDVVHYNTSTRAIDATYTSAKSGLASRRVTALIENEGFLWIVTQAGTSRLKLN